MYIWISLTSLVLLVYLIVLIRKYSKSKVYNFYKALLIESNGDFNKALTLYKKLLPQINTELKPESIEYEAFIRYSICVLKSNDTNLISTWINEKLPIILNLNNHHDKDEIVFEYILLLIKNKMFSAASEFFDNHIFNKNITELESLKIFNENRIKEKLNIIIDFINQNIDNPLTYFEILEKISGERKEWNKFPLHYEKILKVEPYILNYLINNIDSDEKYERIFIAITQNEKFYKDLTLLNNSGIFAEKIVSKGLLTENNYRDVIATYITVLYNDIIFLENLRATEWDDTYRIDILESSGYLNYSNFTEEGLENINSEDHLEPINVEETRRFLLEDFESSLLKMTNDKNNLKVNAIRFFNSEKEMIEKSILNIFDLVCGDDFTIVFTPYFGKKFRLTSNLIDKLSDQEAIFEDDILDSVLPYLEVLYETEKIKKDYELIIPMLSSIKSQSPVYNRFKSSLATSYLVDKFSNKKNLSIINLPSAIEVIIRSATINDIKTIENAYIEWDNRNNFTIEKKITELQYLYKIVPKSAKIKIQLSNLLANKAIEQTNNKSISPTACVHKLVECCKIYPKNFNAQNNIVFIISDLSSVWALDGSLDTIINEVQEYLSSEMKSNLLHKLLDGLRDFQAYIEMQENKGEGLNYFKINQTVETFNLAMRKLYG